MGIKDEFHQKNILVCIEELCQPSSPPPVSTDTVDPASAAIIATTPTSTVESERPLEVGYSGGNVISNAHNLMPHSFSVLEKCGKCHKYLRGLLHQGFLCQGASSRFHSSAPILSARVIGALSSSAGLVIERVKEFGKNLIAPSSTIFFFFSSASRAYRADRRGDRIVCDDQRGCPFLGK